MTVLANSSMKTVVGKHRGVARFAGHMSPKTMGGHNRVARNGVTLLAIMAEAVQSADVHGSGAVGGCGRKRAADRISISLPTGAVGEARAAPRSERWSFGRIMSA